MVGFAVTGQDNFAGGMFQAPTPEQIPANGSYDVENGLFDQDQGVIYRRGGSAYKLVDATATNAPHSLFDGYLAAGHRTVLTGNNYLGVLNSGETAWVNMSSSVGTPFSPMIEFHGIVVLPMDSDTNGFAYYGGSYVPTNYSTGTVTLTLNSATVTGVGTTFVGNVDAGMIMTSSANPLWIGVVKSVDSNTQLTLMEPYDATTAAGASFVLQPILIQATPSSLFNNLSTPLYATVAGDRLVMASGHRVGFGHTGKLGTWSTTDYHDLPLGSQVLGLASLRDTVFAFASTGVWAISNIAYELTDAYGNPQQRLEQISSLRLLSAFGVARWNDMLVVPATDDVYLLSSTGAMDPISQPIRTLWRSYVNTGAMLGDSVVYRDHLFMPVLHRVYSGRNVSTISSLTMLVCYLPTRSWSHWSDLSSTPMAMAVRVQDPSRAPLLYGYTSGKMLLDLSGCFTPSSSNKNEPNGNTHPFTVTTRDYATGSNKSNLVKKARLRFEGTAAAGSPTLSLSVASGPVSAPFTALSTTDGSTVGPSSGTQTVPFSANWADRFVRFKIATTDAWDTLKIKGLELFVRQRGRQ